MRGRDNPLTGSCLATPRRETRAKRYFSPNSAYRGRPERDRIAVANSHHAMGGMRCVPEGGRTGDARLLLRMGQRKDTGSVPA